MGKRFDHHFPESKLCLLNYTGAVYWDAFDTRVDSTFILFAVVVSTSAERKGQVFFFTFSPLFFLYSNDKEKFTTWVLPAP